MSNAAKEMVSVVLREASAAVKQHAFAQRCIRNLALYAENSSSAEDAGRLLLETLGSEQAVKEWIDFHMIEIKRALTIWYVTARIEAIEKRKGPRNDRRT